MPQDPPRLNSYFIETHDNGTFNFRSKDGGGKPAVVLIVDDRYGEWCDLLAWFLDNPTRWWLRHGDETPILGAARLAQANEEAQSVSLHGNPESWIMARMRGVCVIDWRVDLRPLFADIPRITCENRELRDHLRKALRRDEPRLDFKGPRRGP